MTNCPVKTMSDKDDYSPMRKLFDDWSEAADELGAADEQLSGDDYDYDVDWGGLNGAEFARKREQVFADMRSGKLKVGGNYDD